MCLQTSFINRYYEVIGLGDMKYIIHAKDDNDLMFKLSYSPAFRYYFMREDGSYITNGGGIYSDCLFCESDFPDPLYRCRCGEMMTDNMWEDYALYCFAIGSIHI